MVHLSFFGGAGTVTGSCFLLEAEKSRILIDCGLFQGSKTITELNYGDFPFAPAAIDAVILTHAHIDHAGLIPKLIKGGFKGTVHATAGTRGLLTYMLPDSGYIQENEVERRNQRRQREGKPRLTPIYGRDDAERAIEQFSDQDYEVWFDAASSIRARFWNAGHILGSSSVEIEIAQGAGGDPIRLLFSGDLGPEHKAFHPDADAPSGFDYVICESTYGNRTRQEMPVEDRRARLADLASRVIEKEGPLIIPAFAVERTQELLSDLVAIMHDGALAKIPVFLDSPLARNATQVFKSHAEDLEDLRDIASPFGLPNFHTTETVGESKAIDRLRGAMIVISASGMCDAGRIRHHLKSFLWQDAATVLLVGYQVPGTLGALLSDGKQTVRIHREDVEVRAEILHVDWYSGHADRDTLCEWISARCPIRRGLFLVHGEAPAAEALRDRLMNTGFDAPIIVPQLDERFALDADKPKRIKASTMRRLDPEHAGGKPDWRNMLSEFSIDLRQNLDAEARDEARERLLADLKQVLARFDESRRKTRR